MEYGSAQFELQENAFEFCGGQKRVLIVDDLMATGGTMKAACDLVEKKAKVTHVFVIMELEFLQGKEKLDKNIHFKSLLSYD